MEIPSNQTLYEILKRIEIKVDKTNGSVADNKSTINKITGGLIVVSALLVPLAVYALQNLMK